MIVIRSPYSSDTFALVVPQGQEPTAPQAQDRGAAPTATDTGTGTEQPGGPQGAQPNCAEAFGGGNLYLLLGFVAIFYFLILRPGQKQEKQRKAMLSALKKGDRVATSSGIHGTVTTITDATVTLRVDADVNLTFDRAAIARVIEVEAAGGATGAAS